ncbi:MAG: hypothetical protein KTR21_08580 [Rhodobacteraceae bacterium]|nr:hypothetical protein [Paracoccaceae bacterium]
MLGVTGPAEAQTSGETPPSASEPEPEAPPALEGSMTLERLGELIQRIDENASSNGRAWEFTVAETTVLLVTDPVHNRMRLMAPIKPSVDLTPDELMRIAQANFDTALDARYAVARNILWATFIHPLSELHDRQFLGAVGQTVNAARSFGTAYSSGALAFGGGDSQGLILRELIDELQKKGEEI